MIRPQTPEQERAAAARFDARAAEEDREADRCTGAARFAHHVRSFDLRRVAVALRRRAGIGPSGPVTS